MYKSNTVWDSHFLFGCVSFPVLLMWKFKECAAEETTRYHLLKHYRINHGHFGRKHPYPCTYSNCLCTFKTWNALRSHLCGSNKVIHAHLQIKWRKLEEQKWTIVQIIQQDNPKRTLRKRDWHYWLRWERATTNRWLRRKWKRHLLTGGMRWLKKSLSLLNSKEGGQLFSLSMRSVITKFFTF